MIFPFRLKVYRVDKKIVQKAVMTQDGRGLSEEQAAKRLSDLTFQQGWPLLKGMMTEAVLQFNQNQGDNRPNSSYMAGTARGLAMSVDMLRTIEQIDLREYPEEETTKEE